MKYAFWWLAFSVFVLTWCLFSVVKDAWDHRTIDLWVSAGCALVNANSVRVFWKRVR